MTTEQLPQFKAELADLLKKYDAEIGYIIQGDTHGINTEYLYIADASWPYKEIETFSDSCIGARELIS